MSENNNVKQQSKIDTSNKIKQLYKYIKEVAKSRSKNITDFSLVERKLFLKDIPVAPNLIKISDKSNDQSNVLVSIQRPKLPDCPLPSQIIKPWLKQNFNSPNVTKTSDLLLESIAKNNQKSPKNSKENIEKFEDSKERVDAFVKWFEERSAWIDSYTKLKKIHDFFTHMYAVYNDLIQQADSKEMVVANGFLLDNKSEDKKLEFPLLLKKVHMNFIQENDKDILQICDTEIPEELNDAFVSALQDVYLTKFKDFKQKLDEKCIHPLDTPTAFSFLSMFVASMHPDTDTLDVEPDSHYINKSRLLLYMKPVFYIRDKQDGILNATTLILEDLENGGSVPSFLKDIVDAGEVDVPSVHTEKSFEEKLAEVGGENTDILLSKEANREQLEIAQRIEIYNAVLVQGPPGTGKTHTIANLLGHFLAQGKSVLVTSYTKKALTVLKSKVVENLQNLCVSVLDDSREDLERSVEGITEYMARNDSLGLQKDMETLGDERKQVIKNLGDVRKCIFGMLRSECSSISICGESLSPTEAAKFVAANESKLSYIPGKVKLGEPLPLSYDDLRELYATNAQISKNEEREFSLELPNLCDILNPDDFSKLVAKMQKCKDHLKTFEDINIYKVTHNFAFDDITVTLKDGSDNFVIHAPKKEALQQLLDTCNALESMKKWQIKAAVNGKNGGAMRKRWETLIQQIDRTNKIFENYMNISFGKNLEINEDHNILRPIAERMQSIFETKGKISRFNLFFHKDFKIVLENVSINNCEIQSAEDCELLIQFIEYSSQLKICQSYWHNLIVAGADGVEFNDLESEYPIKAAVAKISTIKDSLQWHEKYLRPFTEALRATGVPIEKFIDLNAFWNEQYVCKILVAASRIKAITKALYAASKLIESEKRLLKLKDVLSSNSRINSEVCQNLLQAIDSYNTGAYDAAYKDFVEIQAKGSALKKRYEMLSKLDSVAPDWADAIRTRSKIHGEAFLPRDILDAWKWKQCAGIIKKLTKESLSEMQKESLRLSNDYRQITAQYAEKSAWYHLLKNTENNITLKQNLNGWKQLQRKIGKGTGKNANRYRAQARKLMTECQAAVPVWIMPMQKVFESLVPGKNKFDIVIVDEASQADVLSLAVMYMANKAIIVGDDKQVSPMAVGTDVTLSTTLINMYLKDVIPNYDLYDSKGSLYDISGTTFHSLMLTEHFRCVPEIIGFSNGLSYDYKIKPMRDGSDNHLLPAVVNYHVSGGIRENGKKNKREAIYIVALIKACLQQSEYKKKTFGIISLLGIDQAKLIFQLLCEHLEPSELEQHKVLCGDASNFQGDERDVMFLSMVDSSETGPLGLRSEGVDDSIKKRYNVAASRAKDQMWVVHSLDAATDLKPGDMRRRLIEYAMDPSAKQNQLKKVKEQSESPFEDMVATSLTAMGYNITMQVPVGHYRLDMVIRCGKEKVALECDGERYHSGEDKIREDMERQTILERIGWRFIRIRGSEYFSNPNAAIERVKTELENFKIYPETITKESDSTLLLDKVRSLADKFVNEWEIKSQNDGGYKLKNVL